MSAVIIRTVIADDEPLARQKLRILLAAEYGFKVVAECEDSGQTIAALQNHKPDLLFLDIQMPEADGFHVLKAIPMESRPAVIFTTAHDQYAIRAFEEHVLDYLLKPFDQERLHAAVERVRPELLKSGHTELTKRVFNWLAQPQSGKASDGRLVIKAGGRIVFLDIDKIDWVEASANHVRLHTGRESYLIREGIGHISERLCPSQFVRIHRSIIVNVQRIKELQPCNSGEYIVILKDGKELSCSRSYRHGLQWLIDP
jgi:two-component system LytT family response regulator